MGKVLLLDQQIIIIKKKLKKYLPQRKYAILIKGGTWREINAYAYTSYIEGF